MSTTSAKRRHLELALGEQINALVSATRSLSEESAAAFDENVRPAAFHIARWLHAFGPARPSVVAEAVHMDRGSTSSLIRQMRELGLLDSTPDPVDRRGVVVGLTEAGHARVTATLASRGEHFYARLASWSDDDIRQLTAQLERLLSDERPGVGA